MQVGFRIGTANDPLRLNWDGTAPRPLAWTAWYPADANSIVTIPAEKKSWFRKEAIAIDAPIARPGLSLPLVLLSHGTGAAAAAVEWLGFRLAKRGFIALAIDHHGHTSSEPYRPEGFLCMWERAGDLAAILDDRSWRTTIGVKTDERVFVAGFSAGAYTALLLAGARVEYSQFEPDNPLKSPIRGPREFPNLANELPKLFGNAVFRTSWERRRSDFSDHRVRAALAIAPGRSVLGFSRDSLQAIDRPVQLIGGDEDTIAPSTQCCDWLAQNIPHCKSRILTGGVGHYTFLSQGSKTGLKAAPELFVDREGLSRTVVHDDIATMAAEFFAAT